MNIEEMRKQTFYMDDHNVAMTSQPGMYSNITDHSKVLSHVSTNCDTVRFREVYKLIKSNKPEFENVRITKYNNALYFEFENDFQQVRYIIKTLSNDTEGVAQHETAKYSVAYLWDFLKTFKLSEHKYSTINISYSTDSILIAELNKTIFILAPKVETD